MNRMTFIAPPKKPKAPRQAKISKKEAVKEKPLSGHMYVAMGYVPGDHVFTAYKSAVVSHRTGNQRKNRSVSIRPLQYKTRESIIEALNDMIRFVEDNNIDDQNPSVVDETYE